MLALARLASIDNVIWAPFSTRLLDDGPRSALYWTGNQVNAINYTVDGDIINVNSSEALGPLDYISADGIAQNQLSWDGADTLSFRGSEYSVQKIFPFNELSFDAETGVLTFSDKNVCGQSTGVIPLTPAKLNQLLHQLYNTSSLIGEDDDSTPHPKYNIDCSGAEPTLVPTSGEGSDRLYGERIDPIVRYRKAVYRNRELQHARSGVRQYRNNRK